MQDFFAIEKGQKKTWVPNLMSNCRMYIALQFHVNFFELVIEGLSENAYFMLHDSKKGNHLRDYKVNWYVSSLSSLFEFRLKSWRISWFLKWIEKFP